MCKNIFLILISIFLSIPIVSRAATNYTLSELKPRLHGQEKLFTRLTAELNRD